jgi:hypothetical protein
MCVRPHFSRSLQLLAFATAAAILSMSFHILITPSSLLAEAVLGYVPILLGFLSIWLCCRAWARATHKTLVLVYAVVLTPFAFSYPAWLLVIWVLYKSGNYHGPLP